MTALSEGKYISDIVKMEAQSRYSRAAAVLLAGQTDLEVGSVVKINSDEKYLKVGSDVDEVQTVTYAGTATAGSITLTIQKDDGSAAITTGAIAWNATWATMLAAINTALDAALGASQVVATDNSGSAANPAFTLTFSGSLYGGCPMKATVATYSSLTGASSVAVATTTQGGVTADVQVLTLTAGTDGGTFKVRYRDEVTAALAWDISASNMQVALRALHDDLAACTVGLASEAYTVTTPGSVDLMSVVSDITTDGAALEGGVTVTRTTVGVGAGEDAAGILIAVNTAATASADGAGVVVVRDAVVDADQLNYHFGTKAAVITALLALGIVARSEPDTVSTGTIDGS